MISSFANAWRPTVACLVAALWCSAAAAQEMEYPLSVDADSQGVIYVADRNVPAVWKIEDGKLSTLFKGSKKFRTPLNAVRCVCVDRQGRVLAGDSSTREVYRFGEDGKPTPLTDGGVGIPMDLGVLKDGTILISDLETHRIWKLPPDGDELKEFAQTPAPRGLFVDDQDRLWVVSHGKDQLLRYNAEGKMEVVVKGRPFQFAHTVVVTEDGAAYVCDGYAKAIWKVVEGQEPEKWVEGEPLVNPVGMALSDGKILIADPHAKAVFEVDMDGKIMKISP